MRRYLDCNGRHIPTDGEGYLKSLSDWDESVAEVQARMEGVELSEAHWEVLKLLRDFYREHQLSPAMRPLVNLVKQRLGADKGRSIYLMKLFGGSPAKTATKLAGLPRPENCI